MNTPPYMDGDDVDPDIENQDEAGFEHVLAWLVVLSLILWFICRIMA